MYVFKFECVGYCKSSKNKDMKVYYSMYVEKCFCKMLILS